MWTLFKYEDGSNPYIAMNEKEKNRMLKKIWKKDNKKSRRFYYVKEELKVDKNAGVKYSLF